MAAEGTELVCQSRVRVLLVAILLVVLIVPVGLLGTGKAGASAEEALDKNQPVVVLDAGDTIRGFGLAYYPANGQTLIETKNGISHDVLVVGDQEFGQEAGSFFLSARLLDNETGELAFGSYKVLDIDGSRVGIFALPATLGPHSEEEAVQRAGEMVRVLRQQEQADLVILLSHLGYFKDRAVAMQAPGIDLVIGGDAYFFLKDLVKVNGVLLIGQLIVSVGGSLYMQEPVGHGEPNTAVFIPLTSKIVGIGQLVVNVGGNLHLVGTVAHVIGPELPVPDPELPEDITPPIVERTCPDHNEVDVAIDRPILVFFNEEVVAGLRIGDMRIVDYQGEEVAHTRVVRDNLLELRPTRDLAHNVTYAVTIPAQAVKDKAGNALAETYQFKFTTSAAPVPDPAPRPDRPARVPPALVPVTEEVATGTVEVVDGEAVLTVDPAKVEALLADPEVTVIEFTVPVEVDGVTVVEAVVVVSADLLAEVFTAGRTVVFAVGETRLEIPPGALDLAAFVGEDVTLKVSITQGEAPAQAFASYQVAGEVYHFEIEVYGADEKRKGAIQNFAQPIELTIPYDPAKLAGISEDLLGMYRFDEATGKWGIVPGSKVDKANQTVSAWRDSLSLYTAMVYTGRFLDMAGHWAEADVQLMAARGIAAGMPDGTFAPDQQVTRAQFAALLIRSLGIGEQAATDGKFTDVAAGAWYAGAVETAAAAGLVGGYPDGTFKPAANITRQELAAMVTRGLAYRDQDTALDEATVERILARFGDAAEISSWARQVTAMATQENIIVGYPDGTFAPQADATRAEAIVMLKRMLAATGGLWAE